MFIIIRIYKINIKYTTILFTNFISVKFLVVFQTYLSNCDKLNIIVNCAYFFSLRSRSKTLCLHRSLPLWTLALFCLSLLQLSLLVFFYNSLRRNSFPNPDFFLRLFSAGLYVKLITRQAATHRKFFFPITWNVLQTERDGDVWCYFDRLWRSKDFFIFGTNLSASVW